MSTARGQIRPTPAFTTGSGPPTEETRAFLQQRVGLYARIAFLLSTGFFAVAAAISMRYARALPWLDARPGIYHFSANLVLLAAWIACARTSLSVGRLRALEAGTTFLYCAGMAVSVLAAPSLHPGGKYSMILAFTSVIAGRAVLVPSTPGWTVGLSAACALPVIGASWGFDHRSAGATALEAALQTFWTFLWCVDAVALAVVSSHVIYGLRERVKEAMRLGQYTLTEKLGSGGMGEVYKATHALLKRPAAVKLLPPERVGQPALRRFEREVQITSQLTHPNTIAIFDYGHTASGIFYYAMEYLDGVDLDRLVRGEGPQPPGRVVHVLRQVCGALAEAHAMGVIHRDVKPANVILCRRGGVDDVAKVVDFGLVKDLQSTEPTDLTGANTIAGTPLYLSPEAITGEEGVGPESDLYALGAVGYFLLTAQPPFTGSLIEVCGHHLHTTPARPSERLGRALPRQLEDVLLRCLEKDPRARPRTADELSADLASCGDVPAWTSADAHAWWRDRRAALAPEPAPADLSGATRTMAVSLD